jgi:hypothetical protein
MKNYFKVITALVLPLFLAGFGAMGTNTLYRNEAKIAKPSRIGFSQVANEEIMEKIVKGSTRVYDLTTTELLDKHNIASTKVYVDGFEGFDTADSNKIKELCTENNLDGMLLTQLKFLNVQYSSMFIPIGVSEDTEVEMQYYNADGTLLLHTKHNTHMGNSYMTFPAAERTVKDGTAGALGRVLKEMKVTSVGN